MSPNRVEWNSVESEPDPQQDLGYDDIEVDVIEAGEYDQLIFLPRDEDMLDQDAYIVLDEEAVVDLEDEV